MNEGITVKLARVGGPTEERPALVDEQGRLRDLGGHLADIDPSQLSPDRLAALSELDIESLPLLSGNQRYGSPIAGIRKFIAIGLNYADHAAESKLSIPEEPVIFTKAISCIQGPNDPIVLPRGSEKTDWEVELGIVIGSWASYVPVEQAFDHIAGYLVVNDVSERAYQIERGGTWDKGKGCDTFGPLGPWLVTTDEVPNPQNLQMWLDVNGQAMQRGSTSTMIFPVDVIVSYVSQFMTLEPGDVITTGTPPGVGMGQSPPRYLRAGDEVRLGIEGLGEQRQEVRAWSPQVGTMHDA